VANRVKRKYKPRPCKHHGTRYQQIPGSNLCCHRNCLKSLILDFSNKAPSIKKIVDYAINMGQLDDLISFLTEKLMEDVCKGKPGVINAQWLFFKLTHYARFLARRDTEDYYDTVHEDTETSTCQQPNPYMTYFLNEALTHSGNINKLLTLYAIGELAPADVFKLTCSLVRLPVSNTVNIKTKCGSYMMTRS